MHYNNIINPIVNEFVNSVMDEMDLDYHPIYCEYLDRIKAECEFLNNHKFKVIEVDEKFFSESFRPVEMESEKSSIFELIRKFLGY